MKKISFISIGSIAILCGIAIIMHCSDAKYTGTRMLFKSASDMIAALGIIIIGILVVFAGVRIKSIPKTSPTFQNEQLSAEDFKIKGFVNSKKSKVDIEDSQIVLNNQEAQHQEEKGKLYARIQEVQSANSELSSEVSKLSSELLTEKEKNNLIKKEMIKILFENYQHMSETAKKLLELLSIEVKKQGARNWKLSYNNKSVLIPQQLSAKSKKNKNETKKIINDVLSLLEESSDQGKK